MGQEQHRDEVVTSQSPSTLQGDPPRSLAAVVSFGSRVLETSTTTQISSYNNTATKASERSSNAWHRPPILIPPTKDTTPHLVITDPNESTDRRDGSKYRLTNMMHSYSTFILHRTAVLTIAIALLLWTHSDLHSATVSSYGTYGHLHTYVHLYIYYMHVYIHEVVGRVVVFVHGM
jgi:hypothetical protein